MFAAVRIKLPHALTVLAAACLLIQAPAAVSADDRLERQREQVREDLDAARSAELAATLSGGILRAISGEILTASGINAMNTFDRPHTIEPTSFRGYKLQGSQLSLSIPAKSVVVLELK